MGLKDLLEIMWNPKMKKANLLSDFVDVANQYGFLSLEAQDKYYDIVGQFPQMAPLLEETLLMYQLDRENNKDPPSFFHK